MSDQLPEGPEIEVEFAGRRMPWSEYEALSFRQKFTAYFEPLTVMTGIVTLVLIVWGWL